MKFLLYDTPRVLLLAGVVFIMGIVNSYYTPDARARCWRGALEAQPT